MLQIIFIIHKQFIYVGKWVRLRIREIVVKIIEKLTVESFMTILSFTGSCWAFGGKQLIETVI